MKMEENPYENPYASPSPIVGPLNVDAAVGIAPLAKVSAPAIALMALGGMGLGFAMLGIVINVLLGGIAAANGDEQAAIGMLVQGTVGVAQGLVGLAVNGAIVFGAWKMKNLQLYGFSLTSGILAMVPCFSPCCLIGIPFGIWALVVLNEPEVKASFH